MDKKFIQTKNDTLESNQTNKYIINESKLNETTFYNNIDLKDLDDVSKQDFRKYYIRKQNEEELNSKNKINKTNTNETSAISKYEDLAAFSNINTVNLNNINTDYGIIIEEREKIISIDSKYRDINMYPNSNDFEVPFGEELHNIKKIELQSLEFPNTDPVIRDSPEAIKNNIISWQNDEDIDLGFNQNVLINTSIPNHVDINITNHGLSGTSNYIVIFNSTCVPNIDGEKKVFVLDSNTLRYKLLGGITTQGFANVNLGYPSYSIALTAGSYTAVTLASEIESKLNLVKRRNGNGVYHYFNVSVSIDTDIMIFQSSIITQLATNPVSTTSGTGIITVAQSGHGLKTGDLVRMISVKTVGGIPASFLNGNFSITVLDFNTFEYEVSERATISVTGGGTTVKTGKSAPFRLLFNTAKSLIVNNIGFPDEDSSELLSTVSNPLTTKTLLINNITPITNLGLKFLRIETTTEHGFTNASVININSISSGFEPNIITASNHGLSARDNIVFIKANTVPRLNNTYSILITGPTTFTLLGVSLINGSSSGVLKYGGDKIKLFNLLTAPPIQQDTEFFVENITDNFTFDVEYATDGSTLIDFSNAIIGTSHLTINHPNHKFNTITSIAASGGNAALITTQLPHNLSGKKYLLAPLITSIQNTVDITIIAHGLTTSDPITILDSTCSPSIDGVYYIQTIDADTVRINFVGGVSQITDTATIFTGDKIVITNTNSVPRITLNSLGQSYYNIDVINATQFEVITGFTITTPGTQGIIGRDNNVSLYRVSSDNNTNNIANIKLTAINKIYWPILKIIDDSNYIIRIVGEYATSTISTGGSGIIYISSSKYGFRNFQYNTTTGEEGAVLNRSISLEGENYVYLISPKLKTITGPGIDNLGDVFAKIILTEPPGTVMFDSFISAPKIFDEPIPKLSNIHLTIKRRDNYLYNFVDTNYSLSIKITQEIYRLSNSNLSSRSGLSINKNNISNTGNSSSSNVKKHGSKNTAPTVS